MDLRGVLENLVCPICLENNKKVLVMPCGHLICEPCSAKTTNVKKNSYKCHSCNTARPLPVGGCPPCWSINDILEKVSALQDKCENHPFLQKIFKCSTCAALSLCAICFSTDHLDHTLSKMTDVEIESARLQQNLTPQDPLVNNEYFYSSMFLTLALYFSNYFNLHQAQLLKIRVLFTFNTMFF